MKRLLVALALLTAACTLDPTVTTVTLPDGTVCAVASGSNGAAGLDCNWQPR